MDRYWKGVLILLAVIFGTYAAGALLAVALVGTAHSQEYPPYYPGSPYYVNPPPPPPPPVQILPQYRLPFPVPQMPPPVVTVVPGYQQQQNPYRASPYNNYQDDNDEE